MPIYEYQCQACGAVTEALQKISDPVLTDCPQCGQPELRKKISAAAFRLKGSGWYETDFKKSGRKNVAGDGNDGASGKSDSKSSKTDSASSGSAEKKTAGSSKSSGKGDATG